MEKKLRTPLAAIMLLIISVFNLFEFTKLCVLLFGYMKFLNFFSVASFAVNLVFCFVLFARKRNNVLCIVISCAALMKLITMIRFFSVANILNFFAYALLDVFAIALCEQTLIKVNLSKVKELSKKLFFVPAILNITANVLILMREVYFYGYKMFKVKVEIVLALLGAFVLLSVAQWLKAPYTEAKEAKEAKTVRESHNVGTYSESEYDEAYCGLGKHIVLCLFTFGIWYMIWIYRTTKYLNKAPNAIQYNPTYKLLLCLFVPFYQIYWLYKHGQRIDSMSKQKKLTDSDMATLCLILGIFIPIVACILMQDRINILCTTKGKVEEQKSEDVLIGQLEKYKELLDSGIITQEEFDAKKKQLLGL